MTARSRDVGFEDPWPRDGDRLFVEGSWPYDAQVVRDPNERLYRMPMGYSRAADLLVEHAAANVEDRNNVIYAALFCYRQSVELHLKRIILKFGTTSRNATVTHDLATLWKHFVELVRERGREQTIGVSPVQVLVAELDQADKRSDSFRFPATLRGLQFTFGDQGIDLDNLREVMAGLMNFFECAYIDFSHQDDAASNRI
jgi:hypothetical protein